MLGRAARGFSVNLLEPLEGSRVMPKVGWRHAAHQVWGDHLWGLGSAWTAGHWLSVWPKLPQQAPHEEGPGQVLNLRVIEVQLSDPYP